MPGGTFATSRTSTPGPSGPTNGQVSSPIVIIRSSLVDDVPALTVGVAVAPVAANLDMGADHINLLNLLVNLLGVRRQLHLLQHRHLLLLLLQRHGLGGGGWHRPIQQFIFENTQDTPHISI